ncbi:hypothetical protein ACFWBS_38335 [Streptomyces mirabilis]
MSAWKCGWKLQASIHQSDELRSLREWLIADESLRGRVRPLWA